MQSSFEAFANVCCPWQDVENMLRSAEIKTIAPLRERERERSVSGKS
jgi:hypothetical protein